MRSKISCCNTTIFKKNLTRFAPAWGLYTLCLVLGTLLIYHNGGTMKQFHFAENLMEMPQYMSMINLLYAPLVAQLLFGDLYSSRMCNAIHAMPIRREDWFFTNLLSGIVFSVLPGLVMTLLSMLLCGGSLIRGAWQIPWLVLGASTLQFVCFYGIAVFATMCSGNRLGMLMIYGLLNAGAFIAYWLVDTVYTPMLFGVITPDYLAEKLTPVSGMINGWYINVNESLYDLREIFGEALEGAGTGFTVVAEKYQHAAIWAGIGMVFALIGLVLYKKRDLECAGDALAFPILEPVFQVLGALVSAAAAQFFLYMFIGGSDVNYLFLAAGLLVGWFACRMLIERSSRVFRLKNWLGLCGLSAALVVSLFLTHVDAFGVETWQPRAEKVAFVEISGAYNYQMSDPEDIEKVLEIHSEALETRLERSGTYVPVAELEAIPDIDHPDYVDYQDPTGQWLLVNDPYSLVEDWEILEQMSCRKSTSHTITYTLHSGKEVSRSYAFWADSWAGDHVREIMSRWEVVNRDTITVRGQKEPVKVLDVVLENPQELWIDGLNDRIQNPDEALVQGLLEAIQADCAENNMAQRSALHNGHFRVQDTQADQGYYWRTSLGISLDNKATGWYIDIYPDSRHTLAFLEQQGLLAWEVRENNLCWYG